jgi:hypothetical protein
VGAGEANPGRQRIRRHPADGCGLKDAHAVELAAVEHHLAEPQIIRHGRHQPGAAREQRRRLGEGSIRINLYADRWVEQTGNLFRRYPEGSVDDAERFEQAAVEKLIERLARGDLDDPSQHVNAVAIFPDLARLMSEREPRQTGREVLQRAMAGEASLPQFALAVELVHGPIALVFVDEAGGVAEEVLDDHRTLLRLKREPRLSAHRIKRFNTDHHVFERGNILMDRGREVELAVLDQHHGGHAGDRLTRRGDPDDRIGPQWYGLGVVAKADGAQIGNLAVARDDRNSAREGTGIDLRLLPSSNPCEPR